jgi:hypothetical protein
MEVINNEFDYSNILPTVEAVSYLVEYCDKMNQQLTKLVLEDEEKNKQFKEEYKEYMYRKSYRQNLEVHIYKGSFYKSITCNDYKTFVSAIKDGNLNNVDKLTINLSLDYSRGKSGNYEEYENSFVIVFSPYNIKFIRKSNHKESNMNSIENQINSILKQFPVANCIFCTK